MDIPLNPVSYSAEFTCPKCGKPYYYVGDPFDWAPGQEPFCTCAREINIMPNQYGWVCPICGSVYAPWVFKCTKCGDINVKIITTESTFNGS